ncbi:MAG TPA: lysophospholipid acyltransferase family protein [Xanthobacteraceae bacterium]|nr:lysophospholipid acyltransferase family protein [Xanthobacteraceae bacterium]
MSLIVRSVVFNILFYVNVFLFALAATIAMLVSGKAVLKIAKLWGRTSIWLIRIVCNIHVEWRGLDKIPQGSLIVAAKHQSVWETFALLPLFASPAFILKRELMWIPFFGWCMGRAGMIPIDRGARSQALARMTQRSRVELARNRQIIIFPEGTRRPPRAEPAYKFGVAHLYAETGVRCLPIALNSGLMWPRRSFLRKPGTVRVEILDPIEPGLNKTEFFQLLQQRMEDATARLIAESEQEAIKPKA